MSVRTTQYLMLGTRLPYEDYKDRYEELEPFMDNRYGKEVLYLNGTTVVYDGMCGGYILAGHVIARSEIDMPLDGPIELRAPDEAFIERVKSDLTSNLGIQNPEVALWFVTYYG